MPMVISFAIMSVKIARYVIPQNSNSLRHCSGRFGKAGMEVPRGDDKQFCDKTDECYRSRGVVGVTKEGEESRCCDP